MNLQPIIDRLATTQSVLRAVHGVSAFAQAKEFGAKTTPVAFVVLESYADAANEFDTLQVSQQRTTTFAVVLVVSHAKGVLGERATQDELLGAFEYVQGQLLGWQPSAEHNPIQSAGGSIQSGSDNQLWFVTRWKTQHHIRAI